MNPGLTEMMARDRITELRVDARRSSRTGPTIPTETEARYAPPRSMPHVHLANPQRAIGWFLVSVGLRLALPRTSAGSAR
jgi:hypothetical protein